MQEKRRDSEQRSKDVEDPISQDSQMRELAKLLQHTDTLCDTADGNVEYTTRYKQSNSGYKGRLYAKCVALSKAPKRIRQIAQSGLGIREWGVRMAYFAFSAHDVDKLKVQLQSPYFRPNTTKLYTRERKTIWDSLRRVEGPSNAECKRLRGAVFNIESINGRYMEISTRENYPAREGRFGGWQLPLFLMYMDR